MLTISHILAAENTELEHLAWSQFGHEIGMEIPADRFYAKIDVTGLHAIVYLDNAAVRHISFVATPKKRLQIVDQRSRLVKLCNKCCYAQCLLRNVPRDASERTA